MEIKNLHRHLKRAASNFESRPILKCAHYDEDGSVAVTDSHRLIIVKNFHNHEKDFNQDLTTMKINEDIFPDVYRLVPKEFKTEITISLTVLIRIMKALGTNKEEFVTWKLSDEKITFSNVSDAQLYGGPVEISAKASVTGEKFEISFNAKYIKECCEFFMDAKERYAVDNVTIKMNSRLKPAVFFIDETKHIYLVTPVRTN